MTRARPSLLSFLYSFRFADGAVRQFLVQLDPDTLLLRASPHPTCPDWARLTHHQCVNCPLHEAEQPRCPVAENLVEVVAFARDRASFEEVEAEVETNGRFYRRRGALQEALSSLMGIITTTSGCPILSKLRPLVATHLPFMSSDESTFRTVSSYLLAQYFAARDGRAPDWGLEGLVRYLEEAKKANAGLCLRLRSTGVRDAALNALSILNAQGEIASLSIVHDDLARWRRLYREVFGGQA